MLLKCCTQYASKFGKFTSGHRPGKCQFSFQPQRRAVPKNIQTTIQLYSFCMLKVMLKILQARLQQYVNWELPDVQAGFQRGRGTRGQIANIHWIMEKARELQKKSTSTMLKPLTVWITINWKILTEMGVPDHLTCLLRNLLCRSRSNSWNQTWNNRLVSSWERSTSRLYIATLLI